MPLITLKRFFENANTNKEVGLVPVVKVNDKVALSILEKLSVPVGCESSGLIEKEYKRLKQKEEDDYGESMADESDDEETEEINVDEEKECKIDD